MCSVIQYIKLLKALQLSGINKISKNKLFITNKYSTMSVLTTFDSKKYLTITTGNVSTNFFYFWLRDHCQCEECYNHLTFQRKITVTDIPDSIKSRDCLIEKDVLKIVWDDGHKSEYPLSRLQSLTYENRIQKQIRHYHLWKSDDVPKLAAHVVFNELLTSDAGVKKLVKSLVDYGIGFVEEVTADLESTKKAIRRMFNLQDTLFGGMWEFSDSLDHSDSAYTKEELGAHNDNTYFTEAAGLQILHCLKHSGTGGENLFVDGFKALEILKSKHPDVFHRLATIPVEAEYLEPGYHFSFNAPIIKLNPVTQQVEQIRFNLNDRAPLSLPNDQILQHYQDLKILTSIIKDPALEWRIKLNPGTVVFFDNFRTLHGRSSYTGHRTMCGSYVSRSEFLSKAKVLDLI